MLLAKNSAQEALDHFYDQLQHAGLIGIVYSSEYLREPLFRGEENVRRWIDHFIENNYFESDPLYLAAQKSLIAQTWEAHQKRPQDSERQIQIYREIADFGISKGLDLSVQDENCKAAMCFYYGPTEADLKEQQHVIQLGALYLHERVRQLHTASEERPLLTAREQRCLQFSSQGTTYAEIGKQLGITERTVSFHLQNAKRKLNVNTLAQAIAMASAKKII